MKESITPLSSRPSKETFLSNKRAVRSSDAPHDQILEEQLDKDENGFPSKSIAAKYGRKFSRRISLVAHQMLLGSIGGAGGNGGSGVDRSSGNSSSYDRREGTNEMMKVVDLAASTLKSMNCLSDDDGGESSSSSSSSSSDSESDDSSTGSVNEAPTPPISQSAMLIAEHSQQKQLFAIKSPAVTPIHTTVTTTSSHHNDNNNSNKNTTKHSTYRRYNPALKTRATTTTTTSSSSTIRRSKARMQRPKQLQATPPRLVAQRQFSQTHRLREQERLRQVTAAKAVQLFMKLRRNEIDAQEKALRDKLSQMSAVRQFAVHKTAHHLVSHSIRRGVEAGVLAVLKQKQRDAALLQRQNDAQIVMFRGWRKFRVRKLLLTVVEFVRQKMQAFRLQQEAEDSAFRLRTAARRVREDATWRHWRSVNQQQQQQQQQQQEQQVGKEVAAKVAAAGAGLRSKTRSRLNCKPPTTTEQNKKNINQGEEPKGSNHIMNEQPSSSYSNNKNASMSNTATTTTTTRNDNAIAIPTLENSAVPGYLLLNHNSIAMSTAVAMNSEAEAAHMESLLNRTTTSNSAGYQNTTTTTATTTTHQTDRSKAQSSYKSPELGGTAFVDAAVSIYRRRRTVALAAEATKQRQIQTQLEKEAQERQQKAAATEAEIVMPAVLREEGAVNAPEVIGEMTIITSSSSSTRSRGGRREIRRGKDSGTVDAGGSRSSSSSKRRRSTISKPTADAAGVDNIGRLRVATSSGGSPGRSQARTSSKKQQLHVTTGSTCTTTDTRSRKHSIAVSSDITIAPTSNGSLNERSTGGSGSGSGGIIGSSSAQIPSSGSGSPSRKIPSASSKYNDGNKRDSSSSSSSSRSSIRNGIDNFSSAKKEKTWQPPSPSNVNLSPAPPPLSASSPPQHLLGNSQKNCKQRRVIEGLATDKTPSTDFANRTGTTKANAAAAVYSSKHEDGDTDADFAFHRPDLAPFSTQINRRIVKDGGNEFFKKQYSSQYQQIEKAMEFDEHFCHTNYAEGAHALLTGSVEYNDRGGMIDNRNSKHHYYAEDWVELATVDDDFVRSCKAYKLSHQPPPPSQFQKQKQRGQVQQRQQQQQQQRSTAKPSIALSDDVTASDGPPTPALGIGANTGRNTSSGGSGTSINSSSDRYLQHGSRSIRSGSSKTHSEKMPGEEEASSKRALYDKQIHSPSYAYQALEQLCGITRAEVQHQQLLSTTTTASSSLVAAAGANNTSEQDATTSTSNSTAINTAASSDIATNATAAGDSNASTTTTTTTTTTILSTPTLFPSSSVFQQSREHALFMDASELHNTNWKRKEAPIRHGNTTTTITTPTTSISNMSSYGVGSTSGVYSTERANAAVLEVYKRKLKVKSFGSSIISL